jgi:hypothetical protein
VEDFLGDLGAALVHGCRCVGADFLDYPGADELFSTVGMGR